MPRNRQSSGISCDDLGLIRQFFPSFASEFHIQSVATHIYILVPRNRSVSIYMDFLKVSGFVPCLEDALSGEVGEVNLARFAIFVLYPDFVSRQGFNLCGPEQWADSFLVRTS